MTSTNSFPISVIKKWGILAKIHRNARKKYLWCFIFIVDLTFITNTPWLVIKKVNKIEIKYKAYQNANKILISLDSADLKSQNVMNQATVIIANVLKARQAIIIKWIENDE